MSWDLELLLILGVLATGAIRYVDAWRYRNRPRIGAMPWLVDSAYLMFPMLVLVLALRTFVAEPFRIPSASMLPTLVEGDLVLVNKYAYGLRLPLSHTRILDLGRPARGDVVVFRFPRDPDVDYIKRVVGLPGDTVEYAGKRLAVNGAAVPLLDARGYAQSGRAAAVLQAYTRYTERMGAAHAHDVLHDARAPALRYRFSVPAGHYLVLGDNRDHSSDSRVWGFVPEDNLVGRAFLIWMNLDYLLGLVAGGAAAEWGRLGRIS